MTPLVLHSVAKYFTDHPLYTKKRCIFVIVLVAVNIIISKLISNNYGIKELALLSLFGLVGILMPTIIIAMVKLGYINYKHNAFNIRTVFSSLILHLHAIFFTACFVFSVFWLVLALLAPYLDRASF